MKITYSLSDLDDVAQQILDKSTSTVLLFEGAMGDGKTTLIKALCKQLGVSSKVTSPTFSLVNEYITSSNEVVYHFDFYRIAQQEEVLDIGFDHYLETGSWIFIEWPDKIRNMIPKNSQTVKINRLSENVRELVFF